MRSSTRVGEPESHQGRRDRRRRYRAGRQIPEHGRAIGEEAASKTSDVAGDGTTTATMLAEAMFREGVRFIAAGADPMSMGRGVQKAVNGVVEELKKLAKPVDAKNKKAIETVATIAGNNDPEIGQILADALMKVGKDGVITVEEGRQVTTEVELVEGMQFDRGYLSPHFVTDEDHQECVLENCRILIYEEKISSAKAMVPLLEKISKANMPLLVIAEDIEGEALATLGRQQAPRHPQGGRGQGAGLRRSPQGHAGRHCRPHRGPGHLQGSGHQAREHRDAATSASPRKIMIDAENTTMIQGAGYKAAIEGRAEQIRREIEGTDSEYDREKLQERLAKLAGGVAQINVGAATETAMKERKDLIDDALAATRAAIEEGVVPGGGVALLRCSDAIKKLGLTGDEAHGGSIVQNVLVDAPAADRGERRPRRGGRRQQRSQGEGKEPRLRRAG